MIIGPIGIWIRTTTKLSFLLSNIFCSTFEFEYSRISICLQLWDAQLLIKCLWVDICFWRRGGGRGSLTMQNPRGSHAHIFKSRRIVENRANNHIQPPPCQLSAERVEILSNVKPCWISCQKMFWAKKKRGATQQWWWCHISAAMLVGAGPLSIQSDTVSLSTAQQWWSVPLK